MKTRTSPNTLIGGTVDNTVIGGTTPAAGTFTTASATTQFLAPTGTRAAPGYAFTGATGTGWNNLVSSLQASVANASIGGFFSSDFRLTSTIPLSWSSGNADSTAADTYIMRAAANSVQFAGAVGSAPASARTEINKATAAIADNVATAALTITIPNAAHSGSVLVRVTGSAGAGGAIGANEATASNTYVVTLTRTAGVNAVAAISSAFGAAAATVAGGNSITATAAMSAVSGAVGATNTFTVNVTIARSAGTATNHTCLVYAQLMNANATGITLS